MINTRSNASLFTTVLLRFDTRFWAVEDCHHGFPIIICSSPCIVVRLHKSLAIAQAWSSPCTSGHSRDLFFNSLCAFRISTSFQFKVGGLAFELKFAQLLKWIFLLALLNVNWNSYSYIYFFYIQFPNSGIPILLVPSHNLIYVGFKKNSVFLSIAKSTSKKVHIRWKRYIDI